MYIKPVTDEALRSDLILNSDKIHTTPLGVLRIKRNLCLDTNDVVGWCIEKIKDSKSVITRQGKNWYIHTDECIVTVNARSYTVITAHKSRKKETVKPTAIITQSY